MSSSVAVCFENNSAGPQLHRLNEFIFVIGSGQNNYPGFTFGDRGGVVTWPDRLDRAFSNPIGEYRARAAAERPTPGVRPGLGPQLQNPLQGEETAKPIAKDGIIVRHYDQNVFSLHQSIIRLIQRLLLLDPSPQKGGTA